MRVIYEPRGKAKEYSKLAVNLYTGCNYGCKYCYVPSIRRLDREDFRLEIKERKDILKKTEKDLIDLNKGNNKERILLCFTCDPYQSIEEELKLTRSVLKLIKKYNMNFQILTKGGSRAERDFDLYKKGDAFATTLTFTNDNDSVKFEPFAPLPGNRINAIKKAKEVGLETWVSLEPVISPDQSLEIINRTHDFVDKFKVGKINHFKQLQEGIDWHEFVSKAIEKLESYGKSYYIKKDLAVYI